MPLDMPLILLLFLLNSNPPTACEYCVMRQACLSILKGGVFMYSQTAPTQNDYQNSNHNGKGRNMCQTHVHEYLGSTRIAEEREDPHNHRFAGVTSEAIPRGNSHVHRLLGNSDFYENHHHEVGATTGPAIPVGEGRHVHFVCGRTTLDDGHVHEFIFATLIEDPIGD
jgi:hypothetical protein